MNKSDLKKDTKKTNHINQQTSNMAIKQNAVPAISYIQSKNVGIKLNYF